MNRRLVTLVISLWWIFSIHTLSAQVNANFSANITQRCSPLVVQFSDQSTGNPTSWLWNLGNGNFSQQRNPAAIYIQPGQYTITLIVSDGISRDTITRTQYITVFPDPSAQFSASAQSGCPPFDVNFTDQSISPSAPVVFWLWNFGDGATSIAQNPTHTYTTTGNFNVTLLIRDANGCTNERVMPNFMTVVNGPVANFNATPQNGCIPPLVATFQNTTVSTSAVTYQWNFGNGQTSTLDNPTTTYASFGSYDVTLTATNSVGCVSTITKSQFINVARLNADFEADTTVGCAPAAIQFTQNSTSNPTSFFWDFGDGQTSILENPRHTYSQPGIYTVRFYAANANGCMDSMIRTQYITIHQPPQANFVPNRTVSCSAPLHVFFYDQSSDAVSWLWDFGNGQTSTDQEPTAVYQTPGNYPVTLTVMSAEGCTATMTQAGLIQLTSPNAEFEADTTFGCIPLNVNFFDQSTSVEPIVQWLWDFGDGNFSTDQNPSHTYTTRGVFTVSLTIINSDGCIATRTRNAYIRTGEPPIVNFTANPTATCINIDVTFNNLSQNANQWIWNFGDGNVSISENPVHIYGDTGTFTVTLIALDNGCPDTLVVPRMIYISPPTASFIFEQNCSDPYTIRFTDASLGPDRWFWDFGDGNTSSQKNPVHVYANRGSYLVHLRVVNDSIGCTDEMSTVIHVTEPRASFSPNTITGCRPLVVNMNNTSQDAVSYSWLSNGVSSTLQNPTFTYNNPGVYPVRLIVRDINGCRDTLTQNNLIEASGPSALFDANVKNGCRPLQVQFTDTSRAFGAPIVSWSWNFGDGNTSNQQNPTHVFQNSGSFNVRLTVVDANGCSHTTTRNNFVRTTFPLPSFTMDTASCSGSPVRFTNTTPGSNLNFFWNFGDGNVSTLRNPVHQYLQPGQYTISLRAVDANGCDSTFINPRQVIISDPLASFTADSTYSPCPPLLVNFANTSTQDVVAWEWQFGDGATSTLRDPAHVYLTAGNFDVTLIVTSVYGCKDTTILDDFVLVMGPSGNIRFDPPRACIGDPIDFIAETYNTQTRIWDFGNGNVKQDGDTTQFIYWNTGVYYPRVILDDGLGCLFAVDPNDSIVIGDAVADFVASTQYVCREGIVSFGSLSTGWPGTLTYWWNFGDGNTSTDPNPTHYYRQSGNYDVTLVVDNGLCRDSITKPQFIFIDPGPIANFVMSDSANCAPLQVTLTDVSQSVRPIVMWRWETGVSATAFGTQISATFTQAGQFTPVLIIENDRGCADTTSKTLQVFPLPTADAGSDTSMCFGESRPLFGTGGIQYQWTPSADLSNPNIQNPVASPDSSRRYILTVTDGNGCQDTDSMFLQVFPLPIPVVSPDTAICLGRATQLFVDNGTQYLWSPNIDISCVTCPNPVVNPTVSTTYIVEVTNQYQCNARDSVRVTINPLPLGIIESDTALCLGDSIQLNASGGITHDWFPFSSLSCRNCPNPIATPAVTTTYILNIFNEFQCSMEDSVTIYINPLPDIQFTGRVDICEGETTTLTAFGGVDYQWMPAQWLNCDTCETVQATPPSSVTYVVTVTTADGCIDQDSLYVDIAPTPKLQTADVGIVCSTDPIVLNATADMPVLWRWFPDDEMSGFNTSSPTVNPTVTTTYFVEATNQFNCLALDSVLVTVINKVAVELLEVEEICMGESVQLEARPEIFGYTGYQVEWSPARFLNNPSILNPISTPSETITYTLIAYSGSCLPDTQTVTITVHNLPKVTIDEPESIVDGTTITLNAQSDKPIVSYDWRSDETELSCFDCPNPTTFLINPAAVILDVTDIHGCMASDTAYINTIGSCFEDIFIPNTFTPNGDEVNDVLYVRGRALTEIRVFRIFDRWGKLVFETRNINEGWDGTIQGKAANTDVYVYYADIICNNGQIVYKKGNVTLLR